MWKAGRTNYLRGIEKKCKYEDILGHTGQLFIIGGDDFVISRLPLIRSHSYYDGIGPTSSRLAFVSQSLLCTVGSMLILASFLFLLPRWLYFRVN